MAVAGYALSALSKPFFYFANSLAVAGARWADRGGKGIRSAPRDAVIADTIREEQRGLAFGLQRALDTAGAMVGLLIALGVVWFTQAGNVALGADTFRTIVLISLAPAALAVLTLIVGARDVPAIKQRAAPRFAFRSLGRPFMVFVLIVGIFDLGNSSDAFLILRAEGRGI